MFDRHVVYGSGVILATASPRERTLDEERRAESETKAFVERMSLVVG
jgi:hypothetical protein